MINFIAKHWIPGQKFFEEMFYQALFYQALFYQAFENALYYREKSAIIETKVADRNHCRT